MRAGCPCALLKTPWCWPRRAGLSAPPTAPPLATIRSLAYFLPVIEEVLELPVKPVYFEYLRDKIQRFLRNSNSR